MSRAVKSRRGSVCVAFLLRLPQGGGSLSPSARERQSSARISLMRVVGGRLKGRNLASPSSARTSARPRIAARVAVQHPDATPTTIRLQDARVLDLFAGTGALGIEAVSRGAGVRAVRRQRRRGARAAAQQCRGAGPRRRDKSVPPRRHQSRPRASGRAVLAGLASRSALRQEAFLGWKRRWPRCATAAG